MEIRIAKDRDDLSQFIDSIKKYADSEKKALGFLPERVYDEACSQGKLFAAVGRKDNCDIYLGHLLYGGTYPCLKIFQVFVLPKYRNRDIGSLLVDHLIMDAEKSGHLSVSVRVAEDLKEANSFWEKKDFNFLRSVPGGKTSNRTICVRVRDLDSPRLFAPPAPQPQTDFYLPHRLSPKPSTYVLDVNVLLDLLKRRSKADYVRQIIKAALNHSVLVHITEECLNELRRARPDETDPVLEFAKSLPCFPKISEATLSSKFEEIAAMLFPENAKKNCLSSNQKSDVIHLATAIHHGADGFITSDDSILRKRQTLLSQYSLEALGLAELVALSESPTEMSLQELRSTSSGDAVRFLELEENQRSEVCGFLSRMGNPNEIAQLALSPGATGALRRRIQVRAVNSSRLVAFASWDAPNKLREQIDIYLVVDEEYECSMQVASRVISRILKDMAGIGPVALWLRGRVGHYHVAHAALLHGFRGSNSHHGMGDALLKVCVGGVIDTDNWGRVRNRIQLIAGVSLPEVLPAFAGLDTPITLRKSDGRCFNISFQELEALLSPVIFLLPGREGVIVPIQPNYSENLLGFSCQSSLFPLQEAALYSDRVYYSSSRTRLTYKPGQVLFFYESSGDRGRGAGAVIGCARVLRSRVMWKEGISEKEQKKGVLDSKGIKTISRGNLVTVTSFDNIIQLKKPVKLSMLRQFGAVDGANLVTSRRINFETVRLILKEGGASA